MPTSDLVRTDLSVEEGQLALASKMINSQEINRLVAQFKDMQKLMKQMKGLGGMMPRMPKLGGGLPFGR